MAYKPRIDFAHISFIVSNFNNHVLSWGVNGINIKNESIHSEEVAWFKFMKLSRNNLIPKRWLKKGVYVVNVAVSKTYKLRMSRPCQRCSTLIHKYSHMITNVIWTDPDGVCRHTQPKSILVGSKLSSGDTHNLRMMEEDY